MTINALENKLFAVGENRPDRLYLPSDRHPRGAVLIYTFVVLMLMTLMGAALMVNSRNELQISGNTARGREAFTKADATARATLLLARAFLHPTAGNPRDYYEHINNTIGAGSQPFSIELSSAIQTTNDFQAIREDITVDQIRERYMRVTETQGEPHLTLKFGDKVVGTAFVGMATTADAGGGSQGDGNYDSDPGVKNIRVFLVISSMGMLNQSAGGSYVGEKQAGVHSIVTTIFREIMQ